MRKLQRENVNDNIVNNVVVVGIIENEQVEVSIDGAPNAKEEEDDATFNR